MESITALIDLTVFSQALPMAPLTSFTLPTSRRWIYPILSLLVATGLWMGQPIAARAISWIDVITNGAQLIQLSNMSDRREVALGKQINDQLTSSQFRVVRDPELNRYVDQIGQRLATNSARPNLPYTFQIVDDKSVNAFATMGGFVYVHAGLLKLADNEAELASVMGHEIGHITARHALKQMKEAALKRGIAGAAGLSNNTAVAIGVELAISRPNSRKDEFEADQLGLKTLMKAGYAPAAMPAFMSKLTTQRSVPTFLSTHPATGDRVIRLNQAINPATARQGDGLDAVAYKAKIRAL
jgi:beta-barrel assembly-enhancing protease